MSDDHEHDDVLVPHSQRDMKRVGLVIFSASIPLWVTAWRFFFLGSNDAESHAGIAFAVGAILLGVVGAIIAVRAFRKA